MKASERLKAVLMNEKGLLDLSGINSVDCAEIVDAIQQVEQMEKIKIVSEKVSNNFIAVVEPVIKFLNDNCNPHSTIIVGTTSAELLSGEIYYPTEKYIKD